MTKLVIETNLLGKQIRTLHQEDIYANKYVANRYLDRVGTIVSVYISPKSHTPMYTVDFDGELVELSPSSFRMHS